MDVSTLFKARYEQFAKYKYVALFLFWATGMVSFYFLLPNLPGFEKIQSDYNVGFSAGQEVSAEDSFVSKDLIVVDLGGAVNSPGVYSLETGARVKDALVAAQGVSKHAKPSFVAKQLNLAAPLKDGQKVYIPFRFDEIKTAGEIVTLDLPSSNKAATTDSTSQDTDKLVNVNSAVAKDLDSLPGVGETYAQKIINNRQYKDLDEFKIKSGLPNKLIENISKFIEF